MVELVYCATPARLKHLIPEIRKYVLERGFAPLHPFPALPYEDFEGNPGVGREPTMEFCCRLVSASDRFWAFGVSEGVLREAEYAVQIAKQGSCIWDLMSSGGSFMIAWRTNIIDH